MKKNVVSQNQKISTTMKTNQQICFEKNTQSENFLFYSGISFGLLAQNTILQRTSDYLPLEILSVTACTNFHISCFKLIKFILKKFQLDCEKDNVTLFELFLDLPKEIQKQICSYVDFDNQFLSVLPSTKNLDFYNNHPQILQIFHFFNHFQKRIEAIAMDIEQNNFFI